MISEALKSEVRSRLKDRLDEVVISSFESQIEERIRKCQMKRIKKEMSFEMIVYMKV